MAISSTVRDQLIAAAHEAAKHAHAPYSNFYVGAALLTADGKIFSGCNVENASYGLTICAERNAIFAAVAASSVVPQGKIVLQAIAVVNAQNVPCSPCGACRQVIAEFGKDITVYYQGTDGIKQSTITELLPDSFSL
ncbi:MAG: cytidine deaminase [Candidatus Angelobacter sp.]|jgi:cytidine deaminase|nr:cytidine deaminase [Candidatus Angelobacter sp.]